MIEIIKSGVNRYKQNYMYRMKRSGSLLKNMTAGILLLVMSISCIAQEQTDVPVYELWTGDSIPRIADIPVLKGVKFRVIKKYEPERDGYRFLHGLAIARYHGEWIASFGHNKGPENTGSEEAQSMFSKNGKRWDRLTSIEDPEGDLAVSHGVFFEHGDTLWAYMGAFYGTLGNTHTRAYIWQRSSRQWKKMGVVAEGGFWPLQEPVQMDNGYWIMAGASLGWGNPPAVAICKDGDFTQWEVKRIPSETKVWGESSVLTDGSRILLISRSAGNTPRFEGYGHPLAWVSFSDDYGETWSELQPSNLPMAASKPYAGVLSTGQRYLIGSSSADGGNARHPLTIAVSRPGEKTFSKLYVIRHAVHDGPGESDPKVGLAYPYAVEHKKKLWVVYSNSGGGKGRVGEPGRAMWNNNSAELAIIPINALRAD